MSILTIHPDDQPHQAEVFGNFASIASQLPGIGVQFKRWQADCELAADADQETVITAYNRTVAIF
jgi:1,2-dihydroxy-3-keto-5-methylthiopentene dioxygenase